MSKKVNLESDAKYRSYSVALDKCLKSFEYSNEWADLITSLGRLMKLIQQNSRYKIIPKKRLLGKRLAQCLHPALPSGVHCKTLECFDLILPIMGPENLATDIAIYGPCLFSLLGPSAMSVKPPLFDLFENYFLPLGEKLRPAFLGLLQGLLPGLEEGSEFFERGNNIIERFCRAVEPEFFYTCLWQVLIQAPSVRHFGTAFILNHFNKRRHISTQAFFFGTSTTVMMESLRCLLSDTVVLVQRDTLDFVILALPLHVVDATASRQQHPLCGQISPTAMRDLLGAALTVLLRKDASLNRRLFIWLLGSQPTESADSQQASTVARIALQSDGVQSESDATLQLQYFKKFGLELLIGAIQSILQSALSSPSTGDPLATNRSVSYRPFRLIAGLLNRSEVGSLLMEKVLVDFIFFTLKMYHRLQDNEERTPEPSPPSSTSSSPKEQRAKAIHQTVLEMLAQYQSHAIGQSEITCGSRPVALAVGQPHLQSQRGTRHLSDHADPSTAMARPSAEADFMREAELFFSNLESAFLWPFLESHFTRLLSHEVANSTERENQEAEAVAAGVVVNLRNWIAAVRFLVEHLPIDTYPEVRGHYLPRMVSSLAQKLSAHMGQLKLAEIADFISLLSVLIGHTQEHMVTMFDQSLADVTRSGSVSRPPTSPFPPGNVVPQREKELRLIASTVGDVRLLLGAFFKHFLCTSQAQIDAGLEFLQPSDKDLTNLENNFCTFLGSHDNDGHVVNDMFAQLCRLVVDMCNVPLVRPTSFEDFDFNDLFRSGCKKDDKFGLPEWLACLVAGGALSSDFDLKAICLHTLLDLVEASTSIHGWVSPGGATQWDRCRLLLPVLSPEVLTTIAWRLDLFPVSGRVCENTDLLLTEATAPNSRRHHFEGSVFHSALLLPLSHQIVGVSLWFFLDDSSCLEDTAALLNRVLAVAPNQKASRNVAVATETVVEDFIVTRMLSTDSAVRVEAHRRFALLWHLLRRHSSSSASRGRASADGEASSQGPWASSWRRTAMGLPPVSNEASNVAAFNRCLLILLDSVDDTGSVNAPLSRDRLSLAPDPPESVENTALQIRQATLTWLSTALLTGQVGRVVAPIFGALLHPGTARTSLVAMRERRRFLRRLQLRRTRNAAENGGEFCLSRRYVHASDADTDSDASSLDEDADEQDEEEEYDSNICALSGGTPSDELHFFLSPTSEYASNSAVPYLKQAFSKPKKTPKKSADDDVFDEKYRPVDVMANLQVDSHSNGNPGGRERSQTENARRDVALALLSQLLSPEANVAECNGAKTLGVSSLFQTGHSSVKVLPVHEHLLVYLHTFDFNQAVIARCVTWRLLSHPTCAPWVPLGVTQTVAYALTRIRAILTSHVGGLFLLALAASPTAARPRSHPASVAAEPSQFASCDFPKLFGTSLPDLLARHYRCLLGGGDAFVRHSTMEEIERILQSRMPCLLDVLVFVCTAFLCSVAAPSALPDLVPNDGAAASANANRLAEIDANEEALTSSWPKSGTDAQSTNQMAALIAKVHSPRSSWISAVIQRSGLSQAVLHCLATCVELSHLPASFDCEDEGGLSLCLRLLRANSCTASHRQAELQTLLGLTLSLLQLTRQVGLPKPAGSAPATSMNRVSKVLASAKKTTAAAASSSPSPRKGHLAFGGGLPWCLPGRPSNVVAVLKRLGQTASPLLLGVAGSRFIVCSEGMRHVASQPLLLNTLRLALCPGGRVDLHPAWFRFLLKSLPCWGAATAYMLNLVIMQMGGSLQLLAEPFYHGLAPTINRQPASPGYPIGYTLQVLACLQGITHAFLLPFGQSRTSLLHGMASGAVTAACHSSAAQSNQTSRQKSTPISESPASSKGKPASLPRNSLVPLNTYFTVIGKYESEPTNRPEPLTNITEACPKQWRCSVWSAVVDRDFGWNTGFAVSAACIGSFIHVLLFDIDRKKLSFGVIEPDVIRLHCHPVDETLSSNACGMSEVAVGANEIASALRDVNRFNFPPVSLALQRIHRECVETDLASAVGHITSTASKPLVEFDVSKPADEAKIGFEKPYLGCCVTWLSPRKCNCRDLLGTEVMPPSADPRLDWARGRAEVAHVFPVLVSSLASLWLALNQCSVVDQGDQPEMQTSFEAGIDPLVNDCDSSMSPVHLRCNFERLGAVAALGDQESVRRAIDNLLEPIASTHPALVFAAVAHVWPALGVGSNNVDLMWLLSSCTCEQAIGLPLLPIQCALVSLIGGLRSPFVFVWKRSENGTQYVALSPPPNPEKPAVLLKTSVAIRTIKNLVVYPPASLASAFAIDLASEPTASAATSVDPLLPPQTLQSSLLHFLYAWITATGGIGVCFQLPNVQDFLRDVGSVGASNAAITSPVGTPITSPFSVFLLVKIFNEIIITLSNRDEKRDQKDLQDICQRFLEATGAIAGSALEHATWFRRGLQVRSSALPVPAPSGPPYGEAPAPHRATLLPDHVPTVASESALLDVKSGATPPTSLAIHGVVSFQPNQKDTSSVNVHLREDLTILALKILAEHMALFLDVVYRSDEKDRVPSVLNNGILSNILPFLKSRTISNSSHFTAASQVLAKLSSYQFTRRAWRRDVFELFVDPNFFQITPSALYSWCTLVDNLMTQDKNTFKEALTRLTVSQGTGLNLFSSKEAEYEQRAAHMKKINFIVFASEKDQYLRSVSEILERLTDNLRSTTDVNVPILTQLFLCTRVLIARISPPSLASLWHIVLPELARVFKAFADRCNGSSKKHPRLNFEGLHSLPQTQLTLLLSACKVLATILLLPESEIPQLLLDEIKNLSPAVVGGIASGLWSYQGSTANHHWVFVGRRITQCSESNGDVYQPLLSQITSGLISIYQRENQIYTAHLLAPPTACFYILATKRATTFGRLELFFRSLGEYRGTSDSCDEGLDDASAGMLKQVLEVSIFNEFLEPMTSSKSPQLGTVDSAVVVPPISRGGVYLQTTAPAHEACDSSLMDVCVGVLTQNLVNSEHDLGSLKKKRKELKRTTDSTPVPIATASITSPNCAPDLPTNQTAKQQACSSPTATQIPVNPLKFRYL
ncbi:unnamed protein product [Mesocestoides corti]|uniref:Dopey N-terminal domain-containing protein n=1 Tax=Mesocestoides corti TaxID=53468 RepID=A0A158QVH0_MESCO|nr:unnamed protein product [Mesocestoides corti]